MTKSISKQVEEIINSKMTIAEKREALAYFFYKDWYGWFAGGDSPKALSIANAWENRIRTIKNKLKDNIHSADLPKHRLSSFENSTAISRMIHECEMNNEMMFANRVIAARKQFLANFDASTSMSRELADKELGRIYAPFVEEYKREISKRIAEYKDHCQKCEQEQWEWLKNYGMKKYKEGTKYTQLNYLISPLSAGKYDNVLMYPYSFVPHEFVDTDWNAYSKAWHRAHGPKRTVESREVCVYQYGKGKIKTVELPKWKPGFMVEVVAQVLGLQKPKVEKSLRKFQVSPWVDVKRSVKRNGIQFYNLTMGKYTVGVVAYDEQHDLHYHAETKESALDGLTKKIAKMDADEQRVATEGNAVLTANLAHNRWGFCYPGMTEFANAIGFDVDASYTVGQLREAVSLLKDKSIVRKYHRELETAKIINFNI